jgi:hypothetical protein
MYISGAKGGKQVTVEIAGETVSIQTLKQEISKQLYVPADSIEV